jgi:hypothetical protein
MGSSHQRLVQLIEAGLARIDTNDPQKRQRIYEIARNSMQRLPGENPDGAGYNTRHQKKMEALEEAIAEIEKRYRQSGPQSITPEVFNRPTVSTAPKARSAPRKKLQLPVFKFSKKATAAGLLVLGLGLAAIQFSSSSTPVPTLFSDVAQGLALPIFGDAPNDSFSPYGNVAVENSSVGGQAHSLIKAPKSDAPYDSITGFAFIPLEPVYSKILAGKKIRIGVVARSISKGNENPAFSVRFHSTQLPLEATFQNLTTQYQAYYFDQDVPKQNGSENSEMMIVVPANNPAGSKIEVLSLMVLEQNAS